MSRNVMVVVLCVGAAAVALAGPKEADEGEQAGWLGVYSDNLSGPMLVALDLEHGVLVTDVVDDSPAKAAGLAPGDVLVSLDGEKVERAGDLRSAVRARPDKSVVVVSRRRGKERKVTVKLASRARPETDLDFDFNWSGIPLEAVRNARVAVQEVKPHLTMKLAESGEEMDSLRAELKELRGELRDLRRRVAEDARKEK
jgi:C-terminal processing protease CtpA/Prc